MCFLYKEVLIYKSVEKLNVLKSRMSSVGKEFLRPIKEKRALNAVFFLTLCVTDSKPHATLKKLNMILEGD